MIVMWAKLNLLKASFGSQSLRKGAYEKNGQRIERTTEQLSFVNNFLFGLDKRHSDAIVGHI